MDRDEALKNLKAWRDAWPRDHKMGVPETCDFAIAEIEKNAAPAPKRPTIE